MSDNEEQIRALIEQWAAAVRKGELDGVHGVGIKDLRFGNVVDADWEGHDPDDPVDRRTDLPLRTGPRHFVCCAP